MTYVPTKEIKIKERQDKFLKAQLEKEREQALLEEIEKTEKERVKKKGKNITPECIFSIYLILLYLLGLKVLKQSGILDAYQGLLVSLCKYGLPTEDLYEFSALTILKHEKKLKAAKKKELEERLKRRNDEKQLNPINRQRAASNNADAQAQQIAAGAAGVSPNARRGGSKRRVIGASSVERPQPNIKNARESIPSAKKKGGAQQDEDANPFTVDQDSQEDAGSSKPKRSKKSKRAAEQAEEDAEEEMKVIENQDEALEEEPKKKKKKRHRESNLEVDQAEE